MAASNSGRELLRGESLCCCRVRYAAFYGTVARAVGQRKGPEAQAKRSEAMGTKEGLIFRGTV